jgi:hypothetical protein
MLNVVILKKFTCKGTLRQVFIHTEKGRGELTREKVRGALVHKAGRKYEHD